jgi:hypothetical protein
VQVLTELTGVPEVAQAIVDYRDAPAPDIEDRPDAQPPYRAKNAPPAAFEELLEIPALREQPEVVELLRQHVTVHPEAQGNVNTVSLEVLRAIKAALLASGQLNASLLEALVSRRGAGADGLVGTADDCLLTAEATSTQRLADCLGSSAATVQNLIQGLGYQSKVFRIAVTLLPKRLA